MINIGRAEQLSIIGLIGLSILMAAAYFNPIILQNTSLGNFTFNGIIAKIGIIFSSIGLFAFFHNAPQSYKKPTPNILRVIYVILFMAVSYCSESNWECFA